VTSIIFLAHPHIIDDGMKCHNKYWYPWTKHWTLLDSHFLNWQEKHYLLVNTLERHMLYIWA